MSQFISLLKDLSSKIRDHRHLDPFSFDLIAISKLDSDKVLELHSETKDIQLIHCHEFWELTEDIYKHLMLKTVSKELYEYFKQVRRSELNSIEFIYEFKPWKEFIISDSNGTEIQLDLKTEYAEDQIQRFLDQLRISDKNWISDLYDFDYKFNFESEVEAIFRDLVFTLWKQLKSKNPTKIAATIQEKNGGSFTYNLDSGEVVK